MNCCPDMPLCESVTVFPTWVVGLLSELLTEHLLCAFVSLFTYMDLSSKNADIVHSSTHTLKKDRPAVAPSAVLAEASMDGDGLRQVEGT